MTDYEKEIISYRKQGKTYKEIKQILKISKSTISYYCTKNKLNILFESTKPSNIEEIILFKNEYHTAKDTIDNFKLSRYTYYKYIHPLVEKNVSFNKKKKKELSVFYCLNCGKEILSLYKNRKFCNHDCQNEYYFNIKIEKWLKGEITGKRGKTATASWIKKYLIKKFGEKCMICGWSERNPYTLNIPIELEHMDGDYTNNNIDNLILLCPNCHSLTSTYKGANKKGRPRSKYYRGM